MVPYNVRGMGGGLSAEARISCSNRYRNVYLINDRLINLWHEAELEVGKGWFSLNTLHLTNLIRDPFTLANDPITTRTHPSLFIPIYTTIRRIRRGTTKISML